MPAQITMPQQTDTMTEGTVVKWLKKEGDKIKSGEAIVEIETDKATMEMESAEDGTLAAIVVAAGQKVPVGAVIGLLARGSEKVEEVKKQAGELAAKRGATVAAGSAGGGGGGPVAAK